MRTLPNEHLVLSSGLVLVQATIYSGFNVWIPVSQHLMHVAASLYDQCTTWCERCINISKAGCIWTGLIVQIRWHQNICCGNFYHYQSLPWVYNFCSQHRCERTYSRSNGLRSGGLSQDSSCVMNSYTNLVPSDISDKLDDIDRIMIAKYSVNDDSTHKAVAQPSPR